MNVETSNSRIASASVSWLLAGLAVIENARGCRARNSVRFAYPETWLISHADVRSITVFN